MRRLTKEEFIEKAVEVHGEKYDYSKSIYRSNKKKILISCIIHGEFKQQPSAHLLGQGCPKCGKIKSTTSQRLPINDFIIQANNKHKNFYDYSKVKYNNLDEKIAITCPKHGEFLQVACKHLKGSICPKCNQVKSRINQQKSIEKFIQEANIIHNNEFNYSKADYVNCYTKIEIVCSKHGSWWQTPINHINNRQGCPRCNESKGEKIIFDFLTQNNIEFKRQKTFDQCTDKRKLSFDFYLPQHNICIEYNGIHHYKPVEYFGGLTTTKNQKKRDKIKKAFCKKNNIQLIIIKYNDNLMNKLSLLFRGVIPQICG